MLIGELSRQAAVKPQTVRYYESLGLLSRAERRASGYRSYDAKALEELRFIRKAQSLGFSLDDVRQILDVARAGRAPCARVLTIAEQHLADLQQRITQLCELRDDLARAVRQWRNGGIPQRCAATLCGMINDAADTVPRQTGPSVHFVTSGRRNKVRRR
jgi:MerR family transcriptional regulator, copper efflux regulator